MRKEKMSMLRWVCGQRYELSADSKGLLRYFNSGSDFFHIHSNEMNSLERSKHRVLTKFKRTMQFA